MTAIVASTPAGSRADDASVQRFVTPVRRAWPAVALVVLYGAFVGAILPSFLPERHTATSEVLLRPAIADPTVNQRADQLVSLDTEAVVLASDEVLGVAATSTGLSVREIRDGLKVTAVPSSQVLRVNVTLQDAAGAREASVAVATAYLANREGRAKALVAAESAELAKQIVAANERLAEVSTRVVDSEPGSAERASLQTQQSATAQQVAALQTREFALERTQVDSGSLLRGAAAAEQTGFGRRSTIPGGIVLGAIAGIGLALLLDRMNRVIRSASDVEQVTGLPILAGIAGPSDEDSFRRALLALAPADDAVVAVVDADGTAVGLAAVAARGGSDVALVVLEPDGGLDEGLEVTSLTRILGERLQPSAPCNEVGAGLLTVYLGSPDLEELATPLALTLAIDRLRAAHDLVVVDTPDPARSALAEGFVRKADHTVITARLGTTRTGEIRDAADQLTATGHPPAGVLLLGR